MMICVAGRFFFFRVDDVTSHYIQGGTFFFIPEVSQCLSLFWGIKIIDELNLPTAETPCRQKEQNIRGKGGGIMCSTGQVNVENGGYANAKKYIFLETLALPPLTIKN